MNNNLFDKIESAVYDYDMLKDGDCVAVGVSGGADSMLLLHYFLSVKEKKNLKLIVAHVEHGIRGEDSLSDARFVEDFCKSNGLEYHQKSLDIPAVSAEMKIGVEECARNARYDFFYSLECDKIATAHNLSDSVETILFRLARGSSLKGVCGVPPVRDKIIRPLIRLTGDEIRNYCNENSIRYRTDSTNFDNSYSRNYIRNVLVPDFKNLNPAFEQSVFRFIENVSDDERLLDSLAESVYLDVNSDNKLDCKKLTAQDVAIQKRVVVKFLSANDVSADSIHVNLLLSLLSSSGKQQLSNGCFAVSDGAFLSVDNCKNANVKRIIEREINIVSVNEFLNIRKLSQMKIDFYCDYDKIKGNVAFRKRQEGDKISPAGRGCSKTLKKYFNEEHIPLALRNEEIVVTDFDGIIGVVGYCCDDRVKADKETKTVCFVTTHMED